MNEITAEAGVSKGTLYVYFDGKEDLFKELIDRERSAAMSAARQKLYEGGTVAEALHRFGAHVTARLTSKEVIRAQRMVLGVVERMPELAARFFRSDAFSAHSILKEYLDARVLVGDLAIDDTEFAARQFLDLAMASIYKRRLFGNLSEPVASAEIERVAESAVAMFLKFYGRTEAQDLPVKS